MPPELANGGFDDRSDIYAFGMCALEMFTFKYPYGECSTSYQIFAKQLQVCYYDNNNNIDIVI